MFASRGAPVRPSLRTRDPIWYSVITPSSSAVAVTRTATLLFAFPVLRYMVRRGALGGGGGCATSSRRLTSTNPGVVLKQRTPAFLEL